MTYAQWLAYMRSKGFAQVPFSRDSIQSYIMGQFWKQRPVSLETVLIPVHRDLDVHVYGGHRE